MVKAVRCAYCHEALDQSSTGRPRRVCPSAACQRQADASRRRLRRRRLAGLAYPYRHAEPAPRGGRDPLIRRLVRQFMAAHLSAVTPTDPELTVLETAVRLGLAPSAVYRTPRGTVLGVPRGMSRRDRRMLVGLITRGLAGSAPGSPSPLPQLPEPFSRPARSRGATSRDDDMAWLDLPAPPPKRRIALPAPPERELIDLPIPKRARPDRAVSSD